MFFPTISAYVYAACSILDPRSFSFRNKTVNFVYDQTQKMPRFLRFAFFSLVVVASIYCLFVFKALPTSLAPENRKRFILHLKDSRFGPFRDLCQFVFSFTAMGMFSFKMEQT